MSRLALLIDSFFDAFTLKIQNDSITLRNQIKL